MGVEDNGHHVIDEEDEDGERIASSAQSSFLRASNHTCVLQTDADFRKGQSVDAEDTFLSSHSSGNTNRREHHDIVVPPQTRVKRTSDKAQSNHDSCGDKGDRRTDFQIVADVNVLFGGSRYWGLSRHLV